ncbi:MAG: transcriptional repressor LexA [Alphaproteobacteria bacterium]
MLTKKQRELLLYIRDHMSHDDVAPSFEEMKEALGLKSKSGIHRLITGLVERGYLERLPHRARALAIKKLPDNLAATATSAPRTMGMGGGAASPKASANAAGTLYSGVSNASGASNAGIIDIPLCGKIAAGTPIEAIQHNGNAVSLPEFMLGGGEHYALTVEGDSMIKAGIHDSDTVIIQRCSTAENGTIIVALVDGEEATLKRLRRAGSKIVLEPENDAYEPQILEPERVQIQGRLVSLLRQYH